jgi:hypothetical protein
MNFTTLCPETQDTKIRDTQDRQTGQFMPLFTSNSTATRRSLMNCCRVADTKKGFNRRLNEVIEHEFRV